MATYWENSCSFGLRYVSWYKYLIVSLVFSHLGFWSGNLFLIAPFPDLCLLVPFHYINTLKQELGGTRAYLETDTDEMSVVDAHLNELPVKFSVYVNEGQDKLPTMYWLPKLHKRPYKARFIANSSSCTTTEISKLLTSCLTAIKSHVMRYCQTVYETSNKNWFWSIRNSGEVLSKLKCRGFRATSLSTYDFFTPYTILPHNLIKKITRFDRVDIQKSIKKLWFTLFGL